jgi:hypothetical protein
MKARAKELDEKFDAGEDITRYLDLSRARPPGHEQRRVNVDFPIWMIECLDREASRPRGWACPASPSSRC